MAKSGWAERPKSTRPNAHPACPPVPDRVYQALSGLPELVLIDLYCAFNDPPKIEALRRTVGIALTEKCQSYGLPH